jgi:hypothetical protein
MRPRPSRGVARRTASANARRRRLGVRGARAPRPTGRTIAVSGRRFPVAGIYRSGISLEDGGVVLPLALTQQISGRPGERSACSLSPSPPAVHDIDHRFAPDRRRSGTTVDVADAHLRCPPSRASPVGDRVAQALRPRALELAVDRPLAPPVQELTQLATDPLVPPTGLASATGFAHPVAEADAEGNASPGTWGYTRTNPNGADA